MNNNDYSFLSVLMRAVLLVFVIGTSCTENSTSTNEAIPPPDEIFVDRTAYYDSVMTTKNIEMELTGDCDDALMDTLHRDGVAYIESQVLTDAMVTVNFKFKEACCQVFGGDYSISNDTLNFVFEQSNSEVCTCMCWYRYKLTIGRLSKKVNYVVIEQKPIEL